MLCLTSTTLTSSLIKSWEALVKFLFVLNFCLQKLDGQVDPTSLHGGCKVLSGEKWSSTKWMRQRAFD